MKKKLKLPKMREIKLKKEFDENLIIKNYSKYIY